MNKGFYLKSSRKDFSLCFHIFLKMVNTNFNIAFCDYCEKSGMESWKHDPISMFVEQYSVIFFSVVKVFSFCIVCLVLLVNIIRFKLNYSLYDQILIRNMEWPHYMAISNEDDENRTWIYLWMCGQWGGFEVHRGL